METISKSLEETAKIAKDFVSRLNPNTSSACVIGLYGELGSGKTTFMKFLAENLGVEEAVQSPTFVIMKIFKLEKTKDFKNLIHIDAYRIEKEEEMLNLGWNEIIANPKNIVCVEWPERISGIMPEHIMINFEHLIQNERKVKIK